MIFHRHPSRQHGRAGGAHAGPAQGPRRHQIPMQRTVIQRQIELTDLQIDQLVDELYGLTDEEINIVEAV